MPLLHNEVGIAVCRQVVLSLRIVPALVQPVILATTVELLRLRPVPVLEELLSPMLSTGSPPPALGLSLP